MDDGRLIGKSIRAIYLAPGDQCICFEMMDGEKLYYLAEGDCCAHAYFYQWADLDYILGQPVTAVDHETVDSLNDDDDNVTDIHFYAIKTLKGRATFEFRVSHNGYYGGSATPTDEKNMGKDPPRQIALLWEGVRPSIWERLEEDN